MDWKTKRKGSGTEWIQFLISLKCRGMSNKFKILMNDRKPKPTLLFSSYHSNGVAISIVAAVFHARPKLCAWRVF